MEPVGQRGGFGPYPGCHSAVVSLLSLSVPPDPPRKRHTRSLRLFNFLLPEQVSPVDCEFLEGGGPLFFVTLYLLGQAQSRNSINVSGMDE